MASVTGAAVSLQSRPRLIRQSLTNSRNVDLSTSISVWRTTAAAAPRLQAAPLHLRISCAAKPETVDKVCGIVKKQLALPGDSQVTGESKFSALGADSLDTVEIVMGLEEEFGISVEEDSAQNISTVQDAADLIEELISKK